MTSSEGLQNFRSSLWQALFWKFSMQVKVILKFERLSAGLVNLEKKFYWKSHSKKSINYQIKFTFKISFST